MTTTPTHVQVVVGFDFSASAELALQRAVEVACRAPHHVLHVIVAVDARDGVAILETDSVDWEYAEKLQNRVTEHVLNMLATHERGGRAEFFAYARIGKPVDEILKLCSEVGADLVFVGSHGMTGLERLILGSVSERVVREALCPVMVVREVTYPRVERMTVMVHDHDRSQYKPPLEFAHPDPPVTRPSNWPTS